MDIQALAQDRYSLLDWLRTLTGHQDLGQATTLTAVLAEGDPASPEHVLQELPQLLQLVLDGSRLATLAACCYCRMLTHLSVARCQLEDLQGLGACPALQQLHAPHNAIHDLAPLAGLRHLRLLDLRCNALGDPDMLAYLQDCPALAALDLSHNPAAFTPLTVAQALPQVQYGCGAARSRSNPLAAGSSSSSGGGGGGGGGAGQPPLQGAAAAGLYWRKLRVDALDEAASAAAAHQGLLLDAARVGHAPAAGPVAPAVGAQAAGARPTVESDAPGGGAGGSSCCSTSGVEGAWEGDRTARSHRQHQHQREQQQQGVPFDGAQMPPPPPPPPPAAASRLAARADASTPPAAVHPAGATSQPFAPAGPLQQLQDDAAAAGTVASVGDGAPINPLVKASQAALGSSRGARLPVPACATASRPASSGSRPTTASSVVLQGRPSASSSRASSAHALGGNSLFGLSARCTSSTDLSRPPSQPQQLLQHAGLLRLASPAGSGSASGCSSSAPALAGAPPSHPPPPQPDTMLDWGVLEHAQVWQGPHLGDLTQGSAPPAGAGRLRPSSSYGRQHPHSSAAAIEGADPEEDEVWRPPSSTSGSSSRSSSSGGSRLSSARPAASASSAPQAAVAGAPHSSAAGAQRAATRPRADRLQQQEGLSRSLQRTVQGSKAEARQLSVQLPRIGGGGCTAPCR